MLAVGPMTTYRPPCEVGDPENWFIEDDGKQYPDDELVSVEERAEIESAVAEIMDGEPFSAVDEAVHDALQRAAEERKAAALKRRRHALDACHVDCQLRLACLDLGLERDTLGYGIYGGYTAKQRREIVKVRDDKRVQRALRDSEEGTPRWPTPKG